jgi:uncharacterized protein YdeI (YjbR/CyaY-like superfamily)
LRGLKTTGIIFPEEFQNIFDEIPALKTAFNASTPERQSIRHSLFSAPKQSEIWESRVEQFMQQIPK